MTMNNTLGFGFNPIKPEYHGYTNDAYWEEADRYCDELILQEMFNKEKEKYEGYDNQLQEPK